VFQMYAGYNFDTHLLSFQYPISKLLTMLELIAAIHDSTGIPCLLLRMTDSETRFDHWYYTLTEIGCRFDTATKYSAAKVLGSVERSQISDILRKANRYHSRGRMWVKCVADGLRADKSYPNITADEVQRLE
jgi:hypothetical protein